MPLRRRRAQKRERERERERERGQEGGGFSPFFSRSRGPGRRRRRRSFFSPSMLFSLSSSLSLFLFFLLLTFPSFPTAPWRSLVATATTPATLAPFRASAAAASTALASASSIFAPCLLATSHFSCASSRTRSAPSMASAVAAEVVFCFLTTRAASSSAAESGELDISLCFLRFFFGTKKKMKLACPTFAVFFPLHQSVPKERKRKRQRRPLLPQPLPP